MAKATTRRGRTASRATTLRNQDNVIPIQNVRGLQQNLTLKGKVRGSEYWMELPASFSVRDIDQIVSDLHRFVQAQSRQTQAAA